MGRTTAAIVISMILAGGLPARGQMQNLGIAVDLKIAEGSAVPTKQHLQPVVEAISYRNAAGSAIESCEVKSVVAADPEGRAAVLRMEASIRFEGNLFGGQRVEFSEFSRAAADQLKKIATSEGALTPEQRKARLAEIDAKIAAAKTRSEAISTLTNARGDAAAMLQKRLDQLRATLQQLDMQQIAKQAREKALQQGVSRLRKEAQSQTEKDTIIDELRKLVELRQVAVARARELQQQGLVAASEFGKGEAELAEAKIRLAEREAALNQGGKGDLLERMSDELAMVSVDLMELDIQMAVVRHQLKQYDLSAGNPKQLDELLAQDPQLGGGSAAALDAMTEDLRKQVTQLLRERFALMVDDAALQEAPKQ